MGHPEGPTRAGKLLTWDVEERTEKEAKGGALRARAGEGSRVAATARRRAAKEEKRKNPSGSRHAGRVKEAPRGRAHFARCARVKRRNGERREQRGDGEGRTGGRVAPPFEESQRQARLRGVRKNSSPRELQSARWRPVTRRPSAPLSWWDAGAFLPTSDRQTPSAGRS